MRSRISAFSNVPFVRDVATMQLGRLLTIGCGFITSILYVRYLGLSGYGEYAVVLAFVGTFGVFTNLGQQATLTTFLAEAFGKRDRIAMTKIAHYYLCISLVVVLLLAAFTAVAPSMTSWVYGDPRIGKLARLVLLSSMFEVAFSFYAIALQVVRQIKSLTILENMKTIVQVTLAIAFLVLGYGVTGVLLSSLAASVLFFALTCMRYPSFSRKFDLPTPKEIMAIRGFGHLWKYGRDGIWIALDKNVGNLYPTVFLFALSTQVPKQIVGLLRLAFKLADLPTSFALNSVSRLANSVLSAMSGQGGERLRSSYIRLTKHTALMHTGITVAGMLLIPPLIPVVYGQNFNVAVYPFLVITGLQLVYGIHASAIPILRLYSRIYLATIVNVSAMAIALSAFFLLQKSLAPSNALYVGLLLYHGIVVMVTIPAWNLLRQRQ